MHPLDLKDLILDGESTTLEFKRKFTTSEKIAKEISALANTKGGYILFGVDDDGSILGVESEKTAIDSIENSCNFFLEPPVLPEIEIVDLYGRDIVVVRINESDTKPHKVINSNDEKGIAYIRVGEQSVIASREMVKVLEGQNPYAQPIKLSIGEKEARLFDYLEKNQKASVKDFAKLCNISKRRASQLIVRLVRAGVLQIHQDAKSEYFTLIEKIK